MPSVVTAIADNAASVGPRTSLRLVFRARKRHAIKQLLHYIDVVAVQDWREVMTAATVGYNPITFQISSNTPVALSLAQVRKRCVDALKLKT
jgi:hypothetical protein